VEPSPIRALSLWLVRASPTNYLIIFVKAPRIGTVKTRLAASVGEAEACAAYKKLTETLLNRLKELPDVELRFSPDDAALEVHPWLRKNWTSRPQGTGDLGERLHSAFLEAFESGAQRVVIIGSDCPEITIQDVAGAWRALETFHVVLGPATDGGYWLIGLNSPQLALFNQMSWSTSSVLPETLARAQHAHLRVRLLRELSDVDTAKDWLKFLAQRSEEK
jgi:rSAM/selenodomain-associated transferase 1